MSNELTKDEIQLVRLTLLERARDIEKWGYSKPSELDRINGFQRMDFEPLIQKLKDIANKIQ